MKPAAPDGAPAVRPAGRRVLATGQRVELVVIGASLGGIEALTVLLAGLPPEMPPIAIVLHRSPDLSDGLGAVLAERSALPVVEPDDKTVLVPGTVYLAPGDYHLLIEPGWLSLSSDPAVQYARPSIDVLLESAADAYGAGVLALLLTCSSTDGLSGAAAVHRAGGRVLVQDPTEARSAVLPSAVIADHLASLIAPLEELRRETIRYCLSA